MHSSTATTGFHLIHAFVWHSENDGRVQSIARGRPPEPKRNRNTHLTTSTIPGSRCVAQNLPRFSPGIAKPGLCWQPAELHRRPLMLIMPDLSAIRCWTTMNKRRQNRQH